MGIWRGALAMVVGVVVWMAVFLVLAMLLGALWPAYGSHGRTYFEQDLFTFPPYMAVFSLLFWVVAEACAGWVSIRIAQRMPAVWMMAVLMWGYAIAEHVVLDWSRYPAWYNLGVVVPLLPAVWVGSRLGKSGRSR